jgi:hypothetical protein
MILVVFYLAIGVVFALIGSNMAKARNRDAVMWAIVCFLTGFIGVILLAFVGDAPMNPGAPTGGDATAHHSRSQKWSTLKAVDPDIASAAVEANRMGPDYEELLAKQYLSLGDKSYLNAIMHKISEDFKSKEALIASGLREIGGKFFNQSGEYVCRSCLKPNVLDDDVCRHCGAKL